MDEVRYSGYRWFILCIGWALFVMMGFNHTIIAARAVELTAFLGIDKVQYGLIYSGAALAPIVLALVGGVLGDRYGVRWVVGIGAVVATVGALLRLSATSFAPFFVYMVLMGIGGGVVAPNLPKMVAQWFPPRQVAIATGIYMTAAGLGLALGLALGALFGTWQDAVLVTGVIFAASTIAWLVFVRDRPKGFKIGGHEVLGVPFKEGLGRAVRSRNMWWVSASYLLVMGVIMAYVGSLPLFLQETRGASLGASNLLAALAVLGFIFGSVFWALMSHRIGVVKPIYMVCMVLAGVTGFLTWLTAPGITSWCLAFLPGFFMGAGPTLIMMLPVHLPEFGPRYAANAGGILSAIHHIGSFVYLPYLYMPIWNAFGYWAASSFLVVSLVVGAVLYWPVVETGRKAREKREAEKGAASG